MVFLGIKSGLPTGMHGFWISVLLVWHNLFLLAEFDSFIFIILVHLAFVINGLILGLNSSYCFLVNNVIVVFKCVSSFYLAEIF